MKFPVYPRTKPSGVEWLGDVPEHWEVNRLRWVGDAIIGLTYSPADVVSEGEGTLVLRSSNIQGRRIVLDDNVFVSAEIPHKLRTRANDIVICTRNGSRDLVGKTGKITERETGLTFGAFTAVFRSPANDYMFYVFNSGLFSVQAGLYQTSTIFQLTNSTINAFQIPLPPPAEQQAIAAFLDRETGRVDRLVAKKRELIERLKEKRTALISRTVTRGLPPAAGLPANPPLKPSGVEWLGDVPEHWAAQEIKFCYSIQLGKMLQPEPASPTDEETPYLKSQHVQWEHVRVADLPTMWSNKKERQQYAVKDGDLLVCEGGDVGRAAVVRGAPDRTIIQNALHRVRPQGENETGFLLYVLAHAASQGWFEIICNKSTIAHFTVDKFGALGVALPRPAEQQAIAAYLDEETTKLDALVGKVEEAVERLQEYRTALITAAVTGKVDVRKAAA